MFSMNENMEISMGGSFWNEDKRTRDLGCTNIEILSIVVEVARVLV